jgi:CheY-like chemotaxis protein
MPRVVVADDAPDICALVSTILSKEGVEVLTAPNGAEALELIFDRRPDAVVLDLAMPLVGGLEALERMAADAVLSRIPAMVLTSDSQAESVRAALAAGARDYLVKPFEPQMLRQRVRRLLALSAPAPAALGQERAAAAPGLRVTPKVLVVDDHPETLVIASEMLRGRLDVVTARTGVGALGVAARERPDLVLMDLAMPLMDGFEALRRLRALPGLAGTKVLALALGAVGDEGRLAAFDGVVYKPLQKVELLRAIGEALGVSGLVSFVTDGDLVVMRFHASRLWELPDDDVLPAPAARREPSERAWGRGELEVLFEQADGALARMLETDRARLILDLEELTDLYDHQLGVVLSVVHAIVQRARECHVDSKVVAPHPIHSYFQAVGDELHVEVCWRLAEALHSFRRRGAPAPRRSALAGA